MKKYIVLPGGKIQEEPDLMKSAMWFESCHHLPFDEGGSVVADTYLPDGTRVSTVFLWIDHNWLRGKPILFETMVFAVPESSWNDMTYRYHTAAGARRNHFELCEKIRLRLGTDDDLPPGHNTDPASYTNHVDMVPLTLEDMPVDPEDE